MQCVILNTKRTVMLLTTTIAKVGGVMINERKRRRNEITLQNVFRRSAREWLYMKTKNLAKTYTRRDKVLLESDYYDNQGWGCLRKCWLGYKIAKSEGDEEKMVHYAKGIRRLQKDLGIDLTDFSHLALMTAWSTDDEDNNCICHGERQQ